MWAAAQVRGLEAGLVQRATREVAAEEERHSVQRPDSGACSEPELRVVELHELAPKGRRSANVVAMVKCKRYIPVGRNGVSQ